ncbi:long-chain fatty acid--CoA ligase [Novispirillum itersonii]|uniref:3-methylmercaptopropionyl-CoA ligase n=1 Tax=Novispirillum itersonii TaxID=189 RepID=A0A7W9ZIL6_NOVIT|nr:long-chain fatty acid--CoA ligase [Novispirillum itersonii]MBB6212168.1 fatty-acyl-CoA synthase [Novispirillum itersonii]
MLGQMMSAPLLISGVLEHAARYHPQAEVVSRQDDGSLHRYTYADAARRARRLANALTAQGLRPGERVATLAWNGFRHFELYYAVPGAGFVCHTINPRLFPDQIRFIIDHAEDRLLFVEPMFLPLVEKVAPTLRAVPKIVVMAETVPATALPDVVAYEDFIAGQPEEFDWPQLDENTASGLCYTSGTTGDPKGVLYTHRSTLLHALSANMPDLFGFSGHDAIMPVVPMFHVNAWCIPYGAPLTGAKLVFPGARLDGASVHDLITREGVTFTAGVPTVWLMLLNHAEANGLSLDPLQRVVIGGSACPESMMTRFAAKGVRVLHAWGMTETSPLGAFATLTPQQEAALSEEQQLRYRLKQGRAPYGVEVRICDDAGTVLPWDGVSYGVLQVRGPWIASGYFGLEDRSAFTADGWFKTGDVATLTPDGFMEIVDRTKDVIKSGGEWISSITLENVAVGHPAVREAAAIARVDSKWGERPRLIVALKDGAELTPADMRAWFEGRVAHWWIPDDVVIVDDLPHTATGKLLKLDLRTRYGAETLTEEQPL